MRVSLFYQVFFVCFSFVENVFCFCAPATWNGAVVAVKVIFHRENAACGDECAAREAALSANLRHPNVVQTFMQATRILTESSDKVCL